MNVASITPVERRTVAALAGIFALRMLGLFMILPVFSIYAEQLDNVTPTLIGIALGIYGLTQALLQIPFGFASDYFGRKPIIIIGLCLFILGSLVAASSTSIYGVILGRSLQGASAVGCVIMALVSDLTREEVRGRAMAIIGITIGVSFALSMILGPFLQEFGGVRGIFGITAILSLLAIIMLVFFVPTPKMRAPNNETIPTLRLIPKVFIHPELSMLNFGVLVLHASLISLFLKIPLALQGFGYSDGQMWQFYLPVFLGSLVATVPCLLLLENKNKAKSALIAVALILLGSELGILYFFDNSWGLGLCLWGFFTAFNTLEASLPALVSKLAPSGWKGTALGIYSSAQFLGLFIGGLAGGWLDANYGMVAVLVLCILMAVVWIAWILRSILREV